jgi:hypothetical protein
MGGIMLDGTGDIATTLNAREEVCTMAATRLKAAFRGWKLYSIGADLDSFRGSPVGINQNTELAIQRQAAASLTNQFLPPGSFSIRTVTFGNEVQVLVYIGQTLAVTTSVIL